MACTCEGFGNGRGFEFLECAQWKGIIPWMTEIGNRVVFAAHVELRCVATVLVVGRVDFRRFGVDGARVRVARRSTNIFALTADLATVVVDRLRGSDL